MITLPWQAKCVFRSFRKIEIKILFNETLVAKQPDVGEANMLLNQKKCRLRERHLDAL
jgi:hypothetical protein